MSTTAHAGWTRPKPTTTHADSRTTANLAAADAYPAPERPATDPLADLAPIHRRVARLAAYGLTNAEVAEVMGISDQTVKNHLTRIYEVLAIDSSREALAYLVGRWDGSGDRRPVELSELTAVELAEAILRDHKPGVLANRPRRADRMERQRGER